MSRDAKLGLAMMLVGVLLAVSIVIIVLVLL